MRKLLLAVFALTLAACSGQSYPSSSLPATSVAQIRHESPTSHHGHKPATISNVYVLEPKELLRFPAGQDTSTPNATKGLAYTAGINAPDAPGPFYGNALAVSPANGNVAVIHANDDKVTVYSSSIGNPLYVITMPHASATSATSIAITYDRHGTLYVAEAWCNSPSCYYYSVNNAVDEFYGSDTTPDVTWTNLQGWGLTTIATVNHASSGLYVNECDGCNSASGYGIVKDCSYSSGVTCTSTGIKARDGYDIEAGRTAAQIALEDSTTLAVQYCTSGVFPCTGTHNRIQEYTYSASAWSLNDTFQLCDGYADLNVPSLTADINGTLYFPCTPENYLSNGEQGFVEEKVSSTLKYTISGLMPPVIGAGAY